MKTKKIITINLCMMLMTTVFAGGIALADNWSMRGHDPARTSFSSATVPDALSPRLVYSAAGVSLLSPVVADGRIYFIGSNHSTNCIDAQTGTFYWSYPKGNSGMGEQSNPPTVANGKVYVGDTDHKLYCIDAVTGEELWSYTADAQPYSPVVVGNAVYFGAGNKLYSINVNSGVPNYIKDLGGSASVPAVAYDNVYIGGQPNVYCFNATTGNQVWSFPIPYNMGPRFIRSTISPVAAYGNIYFSTDGSAYGGWVYCLNAAGNGDGTTTMIWNTTSLGFTSRSHIVAAYNKVFVLGASSLSTHTLWCFEASTGVKIWNNDYVNSLFLPVVGSDNIFVFYSNMLLRISVTNGVQNAIYAIPGMITYPALASVNGIGKVFIAAGNNIYCLDNSPPTAPILKGPTMGNIDTEYTFVGDASDIENDTLQYFFDWGDGNNSYWLPENSMNAGTEFSTSYAWKTPGVYTVKVKARDFEGHESLWSTFHNITITAASIGNINGGFGVSFEVKNKHPVAKYFNWSVELVGGTFPGFHVNKRVSGTKLFVDAGSTVLQSTSPFFAFGSFKVTVSILCAGEPTVTKTVDGVVLFFYVIIR